MINVDYTLFIQMINFLLLVFILNLLLYKPILRIIELRKKRLQDIEKEANGLHLAIEEKMAAYEEKIHMAKQDAFNKKSDILETANEQAKIIMDSAKGDIPGMLEQFRENMNKEVAEAKKILEDQAQVISVEIAEKMLGRGVR